MQMNSFFNRTWPFPGDWALIKGNKIATLRSNLETDCYPTWNESKTFSSFAVATCITHNGISHRIIKLTKEPEPYKKRQL